MENLASIDKIMIKAGQLTPCIKLLRGLDIAARQQGAKFVIKMSFSYQSRGEEVSTGDINVLVKDTRGVESRDPMWQDFMASPIALAAPPDEGTRFACRATVTITGVTGIPTPCSDVDTQILQPS